MENPEKPQKNKQKNKIIPRKKNNKTPKKALGYIFLKNLGFCHPCPWGGPECPPSKILPNYENIGLSHCPCQNSAS